MKDRVRRGGHYVPESTVRRRYERGLRNFFQIYQPQADHWHFYDNSLRSGPRLIALGEHRDVKALRDADTWDTVLKGVQHG